MFSDRKPELNAFGAIFRLTHKEPGSARFARPGSLLFLVCLSLSETQTRTYWWCSPPKIGIGSTRPAVWTSRGIGASLRDVRSHDAALICSELGALGLAVRFVTAGLKAEPGAVTALIREGDGLAIGRRMPAPCAVTTLEIALPDQNVAAQCDGDIILGCGAATGEATDTARGTTRVRIEATVRAPMRCSRARRQPCALRQAGQF